MNLSPVRLQIVQPAALLIEWSDGRKQQYSLAELRDHCPCALCREERKKKDVPQVDALPSESPPGEPRPLELVSMRPVGNYAYSIAFSDGHDSGIYPFELLRELGHEVQGDEQDQAHRSE